MIFQLLIVQLLHLLSSIWLLQKQRLTRKENHFESSSGCRLHCLIELEDGDSALCNNTEIDEPDEPMSDANVDFDSSVGFSFDNADKGISFIKKTNMKN